ncbi:hypothetical protein DFH28DRAFT_350860 [Melampsora americana]|nr:hypothetical protein DFH28DRAFT_350860 [Melampsora americana]
MSSEDRQTINDHLLLSHSNHENTADGVQNSFPIDSSALDPSLDPSLDFAMPASNPSASDTTGPNFLSNASSAFLAAINRFTVSIAPKSNDGTPNPMPSDIPVPSQLKADSNPDEDAPHEEDDESSEFDPRFADATSQNQGGQSLSSLFARANAHSEDPVTPISEARMASNEMHTRTSSVTPSAKEPSTGRKKRGSSERITPRKSSVRIKPPEQLAAEALIEQQNPNATKNELRSLKLRALHAGRIAERELGMSEEEKTRRLRLREYVRHKREEERAEKAKAQQTSGDGPKKDPKDKLINFPVDANLIAQSHDPKLFAISASPRPPSIETRSSAGASKSAAVSIPEWQDPALRTPQRNLIEQMSGPASAPTTSQADSTKRKRASPHNTTGSEPRRKYYSRVKTPEQSSIEAQIERDHPNATKNQLKSLKLRALHAGRIAERERDMPEKEKARRLKLREYMRRRREDERGEARLEPVNPQHVQPSQPKLQAHPQHQAQPRPEASSLPSTELNAADHSAAFSIMELTNTFQHQFQQPQQAPSIQTNHNLHLHPLFQMPVASTPSTQLAPQYDHTIDQNYALPNVWSNLQQHRPSISTPTHGETSTNGLISDDLVESALHAALQEAVLMKDHPAQGDDQMQFQQRELTSGINGSTADHDRVAEMEQERIRIAEEEILGVERARIADAEMALIAAAAAEVEKAHMFGNESMPMMVNNEESG